MPATLDLKQAKKVHFIGIGGISMSALAEVLLRRGWKVTGSDLSPSPLTKRLAAAGALIYYDHQAENIGEAELIIFTSAIRPENPELLAAAAQNIPIFTRGQLLGALMAEARYGIAVSGSHGKTTTTSMIGLILEAARLESTLLVGGELDAIHGNVKVGNGDLFVAEACEYYDNFLSLRPNLEVVLNIEADHHDYFKDLEHIKHSFRRFAELLPPTGHLIAYADDPNVQDILGGLDCNIVTFGLETDCQWRGDNIRIHAGGSTCDVYHEGGFVGRIELHVPGIHHVKNALAAIAVGHVVGLNFETCAKGLANYQGTHRRFDLRGEYKGALLFDDVAHHPREIKATLAAAKTFPDKRIIAVFQPHTHTRTKALLYEFPAAFTEADVVLVTDIFMAREVDTFGVTAGTLVDLMQKTHPDVRHIGDLYDAAAYLSTSLGPGDLIITMGVGDVYRTIDMLLGLEPMQKKQALGASLN